MDAAEDAEFDERYFKLKARLKRWVNGMTAQRAEARSPANDEALTHVLQQQGELIKKLSSQSCDSQSSSSDGNAVTRLLEQQTQILRNLADAGGTVNQESRIKLLVVKLPTFDEQTEEWKRFSETFQSMIHSNENIPNIQKFQYLVTSLDGCAAKIIESIELTDANYAVAWELLKRRFDDPRAIKKKHIQCLFTMPKMEKESAMTIRGLADYTLKRLRVLKSLNLPTDSWNELIIHMIKAKLDAATLRAWEQSVIAADVTLVALTDFLEKRCQILERIETRVKDKEITRKTESDKKKAKSRSHEKPTTLANSTETGKCYLCQDNHFMYCCDKFLALSVDDRIKEVHWLKLCTKCLRNDHFVKACKMGSCRECSGRPNTLCHRQTTDRHIPDGASISVQKTLSSSDEASNNIVVHHAANEPTRRYV